MLPMTLGEMADRVNSYWNDQGFKAGASFDGRQLKSDLVNGLPPGLYVAALKRSVPEGSPVVFVRARRQTKT